MPRPAPRILSLPKHVDPRGNLTFLETARHVPFAFQRVYFVYDVPGGSSRGGHAHRKLEQLLVAVAGSFDVVVHDGVAEQRFRLSRPDRGLYLPSMLWRELEDFSSGAVCLTLASDPYDPGDYIRDRRAFLEEAHRSG